MTDVIVAPDTAAPEIPPEIVVAAAEAATAQADAAVEIAAIEADASVQREEIRAETEVAAVEASAEIATAVSREEFDECRRNSETALTLAQETRSLMQSISERLPPPPNQPALPASEGGALPVAEPVAESPPEPPKKKPAIRWT